MTSKESLPLKTIQIMLTVAIGVGAATASAQSKMQCQYNAGTGKYEAPLAWQNTLGAARATSMCSNAASSAQVEAIPTSKTTLAPVNAKATFATSEGEKASEVLRKWAAVQGYALVWDAPSQSDLRMVSGSIEAADLTDAMSQLITGLNMKLLAKRKLNTPDSPFTFPVEALAYSNKVIAVTVKQ